MTTDTAVIIVAMNAQATIARAVRSALEQPEASQVIVIDDGSTDATAETARAEDDGSGRLIVRRLETNGGPSRARNLALSIATASLVCVLDADDYMQPGRLAQLTAMLGDNDAVADDLLRVCDGALPDSARPMFGIRADRTLTLEDFLHANISRPQAPRTELGFLKPLFRRAFLQDHALTYDERVRLGEDFLLYANALQRGARIMLTGPCGYVAIERPDSLSHRHTADDLRALLDGANELGRLSLGEPERRALAAYRAQLTRKLHHREVLSARKAGGMLGALQALSRSPATAGYVVAQTLTDKLGRRQAQARP